MEDEKVKEIVKRIVNEWTQKAQAENVPLFNVEIRPTGVERFEKELEMLRSRKDEIDELLQCYFDAVEEARAKKFTPKEKLKKLLSPLISLHKIYFPNYLTHHEFIPFRSIHLDTEVDLMNLTYDSEKYSLSRLKVGDLDLLETQARSIHVSDEYWWYLIYCRDVKIISESEFKPVFEYLQNCPKKEPIERITVANQDWEYDRTNKKWIDNKGVEADKTTQRIIRQRMSMLAPPDYGKSLADIYELWLPTLTEEKIKNKDLLDQILVCYTIKNALNGDQKAVDKLVELFRGVAIAKAITMAKKRGLLKYQDDIKQEAGVVLRLLISGFSAKSIMDSLLTDDCNFLPIPKSIITYFNRHYSEYVPTFIKPTFKKEIVELILSGDYILSNVYSFLTPYTSIRFWTSWMKPEGSRINRFNSYSFIPNKKTNITTWLFGTGKNYMQGRFCQYINDYVLKKYDKIRNEINTGYIGEKESVEFPDSVNLKTGYVCKQCKKNVLAFNEPKTCEEHENPQISSQIKEKKKRQVSIIDDSKLTRAKNEMIRRGIFRRNVEKSIDIVLLKMQSYSYGEIAEASGISRRQVINICNKVKNS